MIAGQESKWKWTTFWFFLSHVLHHTWLEWGQLLFYSNCPFIFVLVCCKWKNLWKKLCAVLHTSKINNLQEKWLPNSYKIPAWFSANCCHVIQQLFLSHWLYKIKIFLSGWHTSIHLISCDTNKYTMLIWNTSMNIFHSLLWRKVKA